MQLSVIVPAYNAGRFLKDAVDSLLSQRIPGLEVVVVDDGSTDGCTAGLDAAAVRIVHQPNRGEASARNTGVKASAGSFITFLDADDLIVPRALSRRLEFLIANPEEAAVGGLPSRLIDADGRVAAEVFSRMAAKLQFPFRLTDSFYREGKFFPVSCSLYMYRRETFDRVGPYDETLPVAPDCDFHFRLLKSASIPILPIPVFDRRMHGGNLSLAGSSFKPEIIEAVRAINRRHGFDPKEIVPWEREYL
jgi:glycosyltransferase involved in cell wall biosynthesis